MIRRQQARLPDPVQAMGIPLKTEPCTQKRRARRPSQGPLGTEHEPTRYASNLERGGL